MDHHEEVENHEKCFYCGCLLRGNIERDHFPIPQAAGGEFTVPACISCHDMKDRFSPGSWPDEWIQKIIEGFPSLNRESRILLAAVMRINAQVRHDLLLENSLREHAAKCPLGYIEYLDAPKQLVFKASTTADDVVRWLKEMDRIAGSDSAAEPPEQVTE